MKKQEIEVGKVFGKLTVLGESETNPYKFVLRCECGTVFEATKGSVRSSGNTRSCGCARVNTLRQMKTTHGLREHPLYTTWADMRKRCLSPKNAGYKNYGGRGISICERWNNFANFVEDMGEKPTSEHTLERNDTNGNYEPSNCEWATRTKQVLNQRCSLRYEYKGKLCDIHELLVLAEGLSIGTLRGRLHKGWPVALAVDTPLGASTWFNRGRDLTQREGVVQLYSSV